MTLKRKKQTEMEPVDDTDNALIQEFKKKRQFKEDDASIVKRSKAASKGFYKKKKEFGKEEKSEKTDWKKVKEDAKTLKVKRKQYDSASNETYELGVSVKKIWEEVRRDDCNTERKAELCQELYTLVKGKVGTLIYAHDTVRVIETLISSGGEKYRTFLFVELKKDLLKLSKNKYSRFFVLKLLRYGTKQQRSAIMEALKGQVPKLMRHKIACEVVELAYNDYANAKQRSDMIQEFYSDRFKRFKEDIHNLEQALEKFPEMKKEILENVNRTLMKVIEKGIFTNTMVHTLLKEFLYVCSDAHKKEIIDGLKEGLLPIVHTRDGARVAMLCLWYGTPKERKVLLKSFKGHYQKIATEEYGHMVLLAAFDCVDDTVFMKKAVLDELCQDLDTLFESEPGKKVITYLISPRNKTFFHPDVLTILAKGDGNPHSKKDTAIRQNEMREGIQLPILNIIKTNVKKWAKDSHWTLFLGAALQHLDGEPLAEIYGDLAEICAEPCMSGVDNHFLEVSYMNKMFTYLIQCDKQRFIDKKQVFSTHLIDIAESEMVGWVISNRGCFVLVKLIETDIPEVVEKVKTTLKGQVPKLKKLKFAGATVLLKKLTEN